MDALHVSPRRALSAAAALAVAALAGAAHANPVKVTEPLQCGNGYCDAWAGENDRTCPQDCAKKAPVAPAPTSYPYSYIPYPYPYTWQPGTPPPGYRVTSRPYVGLLAAGGATLLAGHILTMSVGFTRLGNDGAWSAIPVAGGFVAGAKAVQQSCSDCVIDFSSLDLAAYRAFIYTFSVVQLGGLAMLVAGSVARRETIEAIPFRVAPLAAPGAGGLAISGTF
jgi:hypothetical protein